MCVFINVFASEAIVTYRYDVFVSYRRHREWTSWTRDHLCRLLDAYLFSDLGRKPDIFVDERIEPGADWPNRLAGALGRARVLLPVFSRDYFGSDWCLHELDLMHDRASRFPGKCLIIPVVGHDGDLIPVEITRLQSFDLKDFRITDMRPRTRLLERFSRSVKQLSPELARAIESVPPFDDGWHAECQSRFDAVYLAGCGVGPAVSVKTLTLKQILDPMMPPRVAM